MQITSDQASTLAEMANSQGGSYTAVQLVEETPGWSYGLWVTFLAYLAAYGAAQGDDRREPDRAPLEPSDPKYGES
jgi:hypothetical protein